MLTSGPVMKIDSFPKAKNKEKKQGIEGSASTSPLPSLTARHFDAEKILLSSSLLLTDRLPDKKTFHLH